MSTLRLCLLGPPRLERDGVPLDLTYRKNAALLAYLAVTGERQTREALITLLWPELEPSRARASLRRNLSVLRKALGGEFLVVDRETVGLDPAADLWLDVDQFRRLLSAWRGHGHPEADVCAECLAALSEAVELYRGDFLAGFSLRDSLAFDEWQFFETEELRRELASALERLARGHRAQGDPASAIPYARRWLALDPLHEPAHRHLMLLYAQTGQRAAALRQYQECARILEAELGLSLSRETTSLYERIRAQPAGREVPLSSVPSPRHNLPAQTTPFVGRERELAEIAALLADPDCRLLSLVGPGGIGKTRLALEAAREQVGRYKDGVYWIPLAPLRSVETMVSALAQAIDFPLHGAGDPWPRLLAYLREKQILLVLDNLEHLLDAGDSTGRGAVDLVNGILRGAPNVKSVITSRVRPNVQSEHLLPVAGMAYPPTLTPAPSPQGGRGESKDPAQSIRGASRKHPEQSVGPDASRPIRQTQDVSRYSAVRLFLATARRVRVGFEPTDEELADVVQICRLVQGMPLAILLAAAWIEMLSPAEVVVELAHGYSLLEADLRDLPERQRSIEAVFDASWRMLDDAERETFTRLSVFRGGFTREAAQEVAGAGLRTLISLVHKSLLQRDAAGRFEVHELLRLYAEHKLAEDPEEKERISDLHCRHYGKVLRRETERIAHGEGVWGRELDNLRAGWHWAVNQARFVEVTGYQDLFYTLGMQGLFKEALSSLEWATDVHRAHCARDGTTGERGVALGVILINLGRTYQLFDQGARIELREELVEEGVSILRSLSAKRQLAYSARDVAWTYGLERDADARAVLEESIAFCREQGDLEGVARLLPVLGEIAIRRGAYGEAERHGQEAIRIGEQAGRPYAAAYVSVNAAKIAYFRGDYYTAKKLYERALVEEERTGGKSHTAMFYSFVGDTALAMGDYDLALAHHQRAQALYKEMAVYWAESASGQHYGWAYSLDRLGDIAMALGDVAQASEHYRQALEIARDHPCVTLYLDVLVSQAALLAQGEGRERAAELAALALHHPASHVEVTRRARKLLDQLQAGLPPDVFAEVQERGQARELEATMKELLGELEE